MQHALIPFYDEASYLNNEQAESIRHEYVAGEVVQLASVELDVPMAELYADTGI